MQRRVWISAAVLLAHWACSSGDDDAGPTEPVSDTVTTPVLDGRVEITAAKEVVPAGGFTATDAGESSLAEATRTEIEALALFESYLLVLDLGPDGATFDPPLAVRAALPAPEARAGAVGGYLAFSESAAGVESLPLTTGSFDEDGNVWVEAEVSHFSKIFWVKAELAGANITLTMPQSGTYDMMESIELTIGATSDSPDLYKVEMGVGAAYSSRACLWDSAGFDGVPKLVDVPVNGSPFSGSHTGRVQCARKCENKSITGWANYTLSIGPPPGLSFLGFTDDGSFSCEWTYEVPGSADPRIYGVQYHADITVKTLIKDGLHYPVHQFRMGGPEPLEPECGCPGGVRLRQRPLARHLRGPQSLFARRYAGDQADEVHRVPPAVRVRIRQGQRVHRRDSEHRLLRMEVLPAGPAAPEPAARPRRLLALDASTFLLWRPVRRGPWRRRPTTCRS